MNSVSQVHEELRFSTYLLWAGWVSDIFNKASASAPILERIATISALPTLARQLVNLVSPCMSLVLFKLLLLLWSLE